MENSTMASEAAAVHLEEIGQIAVTVVNLEEAKAFYGDVLGMRFLFDAGRMAFFQCGTVRLLIGASEPGKGKPSAGMDGTILYFRVADIQAVHSRVEDIESVSGQLKEKGVKFVQEPHLVARMKSHDFWLAFLKDPSGNIVALMEEKPRA
jgi:methylmalonyl-CoA/ethylmalonyl-CoA epimerase